jgi:hypothetical protein
MYDDTDYESENSGDNGEVTFTHLERIIQILEESGLDYKETLDEDGLNSLKMRNGVSFSFDDDGSLVGIKDETT